MPSSSWQCRPRAERRAGIRRLFRGHLPAALALLVATPVLADEPLNPPAGPELARDAGDGAAAGWRWEAGLLAGVKSDATATFGARVGDTFGLGGVQATAGFGLLEVEGNVHGLANPVADRARAAWGGALRLGLRTDAFTLRAGATLQLTGSGPAATQWLPSLHAGWRSGRFGLSSGVFDGLGYVPAHLSAHWEGFSLGYVLPLGARAGAAFRVSEHLGLRVDAFAFGFGSYQTALLTIAAVYGEASSQENAAP